MNTLIVKDESAAGDLLHEIILQFDSEYISAKELIEARVTAEIERYENDVKSFANNLVKPSNLEQRLNQSKSPSIDPEKQIYIALKAFQNNGFILLVDEEQVETLDEKFLVAEATQVSFIKLTPLVGG